MKKAFLLSLAIAIPFYALVFYFVATSINNITHAVGPAPANTNQQVPVTVDKPTPVDATALDYYYEIGLGSEFGSSSSAAKKWKTSSIAVGVKGMYDQNSLTCIDQTISDFNTISKEAKLKRTQDNPAITIHFAPESSFGSLLTDYVPGNSGFFSTYADATGALNKATVLIDTSSITDVERCHLIREELTQSLGLMNDSPKYSDSMFYTEWTRTTQYSDLDKKIISILYGGNGITPGMSRAEIGELFEQK